MVRLITSPVDSLFSLQRSLSDTMLSGRSGSGLSSRGDFPPVNVFKTDDEYAIVAELPGVSKDNIDIKLENRRLSIQGHIDNDNHENFKPVYKEYNVGHFSRDFTLSSEIDTENIKASVADGVLTLVLPKAKETRLRKIQVN